MSTVNFNDTAPAAPTGTVNIKFLSDASGNISAYDPVGSWQNWTPTLSTAGNITGTLKTITDAQYLRAGPVVYVKFRGTITLGGGLTNGYLSLTLPTAVVGSVCIATGVIIAAGGGGTWIYTYASGSALTFWSQTYAAAGDTDFAASLTYRAA
jgi:hypothetical protein